MSELRDLQVAFAAAVLSDNTEGLARYIVARDMPPADRVAIYRNNAAIGFANALAAQFPVIQELGGEAWFHYVAEVYRRRYPSRSGNLFRIGARFPGFLSGYLLESRYGYFADVARLEWACHVVLSAADSIPLNLLSLADVNENDYGRLRFHLRPSVRIVESRHAILSVWSAHRARAGSTPPHTIDEPQRVCVSRRNDSLSLTELSLGEYLLMRAFSNGLALHEALETVQARDPGFDMESTLSRLASLDIFSEFSLAPLL